ncbi:MAG: cupin domain-containing protein [Hyphomicrobiales bacterium]
MPASARPPIVGQYELLQDFEAPAASIRVFRVAAGGEGVEPHIHRRSTQFYVALEGRVVIEKDGIETRLEPFEVLSVPPGSMHAARAAGGEAIVLNISVPPLAPDDQVAVESDFDSPDLRLPGHESDLED